MTEKPNLEDLLKAITESMEDDSEKSIVQLYLKDPKSLSADGRQKAAKVLKKFLSKYPEISFKIPKQNNVHRELRKYEQRIEKLIDKYETWERQIYNEKEKYWDCCRKTIEKYRLALEEDEKEVGYLQAEILELHEQFKKGLIETVEIDEEWDKTLENGAERLDALKKEYQKNCFADRDMPKLIGIFSSHKCKFYPPEK